MSIKKNTASQKAAIYAHDTNADAAKTGDAANIFGYISLDGAAAAFTNDLNPTELNATWNPGVYIFDLTQAETNADMIVLSANSNTANVKADPTIIYTDDDPVDANVTQIDGQSVSLVEDVAVEIWGYTSRTLTGTTNANVTQISGDSTAADNLEAAFDGDGYDIGGIDVSELNQIVDDLINGGRLDLLIDAIKAKTDNLTFTTANKVDSRVDNWAGTATTISATTSLPEVDAKSISDDATAADNLETAFDGGSYDLGGIDISELNQIVDDLINGGRLDLLIDAIKAKTDQLTFTTSNKVDSRVDNWAGTATTISSTTGLPEVDAKSISDDATAADNAELFFDNTGFNASNSTIGTVSSVPSIGYVTNVGGVVQQVNLKTATQASIDAIEADTNEMQGKLPDNNIMGSSVTTDKDDEIDSIKTTVEGLSSSGTTPAAVWGYASKTLTNEPTNWSVMEISSIGYVSSNVLQFSGAAFSLIDTVDANLTQVKGNTSTVDNIENDYDGTGYNKSNSTIGTATDVTNQVSADMTAISGDSTAADNAEAFFDNAGFNASNSTIGTVSSVPSIGYVTNVGNIVNVPNVNVAEISDDATAADNLELDYDGTGYNKANSTIGTATNLTEEISASATIDNAGAATIWGYASRGLTDTVNLSSATETQIDTIETMSNKIDDTLEDDGGTFRFTSNALEQAPVGGGSVNANLTQILGSNIQESSTGYVANNFDSFFDVFPIAQVDCGDLAEMKRIIQSRSG